MAPNWYVRINHEKVAGPFSAKQLKNAADSGRIHRRNVVRKGENGEWITADRIKGLLTLDAANPALANEDLSEESIASWLGEGEIMQSPPVPTPSPPTEVTADKDPIAVPIIPRPTPPKPLSSESLNSDLTDTTTCPFCLETIRAGARKCRFCHEYLSPTSVSVTDDVKTSWEEDADVELPLPDSVYPDSARKSDETTQLIRQPDPRISSDAASTFATLVLVIFGAVMLVGLLQGC